MRRKWKTTLGILVAVVLAMQAFAVYAGEMAQASLMDIYVTTPTGHTISPETIAAVNFGNTVIKSTDGTEYGIDDFSEDRIVIIFGKYGNLNASQMMGIAREAIDEGQSLKILFMETGEDNDYIHRYQEYNPDDPDIVFSINYPYNYDRMGDFVYKYIYPSFESACVYEPVIFVLDKNRNVEYYSMIDPENGYEVFNGFTSFLGVKGEEDEDESEDGNDTPEDDKESKGQDDEKEDEIKDGDRNITDDTGKESSKTGETSETGGIGDIVIKTPEGREYGIGDFSEDYIALFFGRGSCWNTNQMTAAAETVAKSGVSIKIIMMDVDDEDASIPDYQEKHPEVLVSLNPFYNNSYFWKLVKKQNLTDESTVSLPGTFILDKDRKIVLSSLGYDKDKLASFFEPDPLKPDNKPDGTVLLSFDSNGGSDVASREMISGETASAPDFPVKSGYCFGGWYKDKDCLNRWDFRKDTVNTSTTLYAAWTEAKPPETLKERVSITGSNIGRHNSRPYHTGDVGMPSYSYLTDEGGKLMRVQYDEDYGLFAEYYDASFKFLNGLKIPEELPLFGAFYSDGSYYYTVTGSNNLTQCDTCECYRITKYNKSWEKLAFCSLSNCNTYEPFAAGSCRLDSSGNMLFVHTCHTMYEASDGKHHQANVTIRVDTGKMDIVSSGTSVGSSYEDGYSSHSFNQFVKSDGDSFITLSHGDAYPRTVRLTEYKGDSLSDVDVLDIPGETGDNNTGVTVGGLGVADDNYLVALTHANWDNGYDSSDYVKNVYIARVGKKNHTVSIDKVTSYQESEKGCGASTPFLIRLDNGEFLLLWSRFKKGVSLPFTDNTVYYQKFNGDGEAWGDVYEMEGYLSDAEPVLKDGKLYWYAYAGDSLVFHTIDKDTMEASSYGQVTEEDIRESEDGKRNKDIKEQKKKGSETAKSEYVKKAIRIPGFGSDDTVSMNISVNPSVSYNGRKHVASTDPLGKKKTGDLDITVSGNVPESLMVTYKYKNNKSAAGKTPYFYLKLKGFGLEKEDKRRLKEINRFLKLPENRVEFQINPCNISGRPIQVWYTLDPEGNRKITKVNVEVDGRMLKLSKKDYILDREGSRLYITGRRNFTGTAHIDL